jgi:hypothetical protein
VEVQDELPVYNSLALAYYLVLKMRKIILFILQCVRVSGNNQESSGAAWSTEMMDPPDLQ